MGRCTLIAVVLTGLGTLSAPAQAGQLILVEEGVSHAPIILFEGAPPMTRRAAEELATYFGKVSGARPKVIMGEPDPVPEHAIWVGYQPVLEELFPDLEFEFSHQEEVLIAANEDHLVIAGRDRWDDEHLNVEGRNRTIEGWQREYGTVNAVYTFLQDHLDVRWIMPGEFGEDIIERNTIALEPFEYRHHPPFLERAEILRFSKQGDSRRHSHDWARLQRLQLDSVTAPGGHSASDWWEKYHEDHPEYFALQPDGARSGYPSPRYAKRCLSNPAVWDRWLEEVEQMLEEDPNRGTANGSLFATARILGSCTTSLVIGRKRRIWPPPTPSVLKK